MSQALSTEDANLIFKEARTYRAWKNTPVSQGLLTDIYNLCKYGPTSANCSPMRITFLTTASGKERLKPHLDPGNVDKTMSAPVTAIIAYDLDFYERMDVLYPHTNAKAWFVGKPDFIKTTAALNSTLQGGYFIIAARSFGLDCGPMTGFNNDGLDKEFFPDGKTKSVFLCNLGHGDGTNMLPRDPRLSFDEACQIL